MTSIKSIEKCIEYTNGDKKWYKNEILHRDNDLPAVEFENGTKKWYQYGLLHRDNDLPAIEFCNGTKQWYKNGKLYNKDHYKKSNYNIIYILIILCISILYIFYNYV